MATAPVLEVGVLQCMVAAESCNSAMAPVAMVNVWFESAWVMTSSPGEGLGGAEGVTGGLALTGGRVGLTTGASLGVGDGAGVPIGVDEGTGEGDDTTAEPDGLGLAEGLEPTATGVPWPQAASVADTASARAPQNLMDLKKRNSPSLRNWVGCLVFGAHDTPGR